MAAPNYSIHARHRVLELVFAHSDADSTVTIFIWQQSDDVVMIALTAAVR